MSLERKDVKSPRITKLDPDDHERLKIIAESDDLDIGEWVEQLILREIEKRWAESRAASSLAERLEQVGVSGKNRESSGAPGSDRASTRR